MSRASAELDHIFLFVPDEGAATEMMATAGLRVNYSRTHVGQGTTNVCACLDDMFIELLWLDGSSVSAETETITLAARGRSKGLPLGISWREESGFDTVQYSAPFLPAGMTIPVARDSLNLDLPFLFQTPDATKPRDRKDGLVGNRQLPELASLGHCEIRVPNPDPVARLLRCFDQISVSEGSVSLHFTLLDPAGQIAREFTWASTGAS